MNMALHLATREEMTAQFAALRTEMKAEFSVLRADMRAEIKGMGYDILKWVFTMIVLIINLATTAGLINTWQR